jgi:hypothetical protein
MTLSSATIHPAATKSVFAHRNSGWFPLPSVRPRRTHSAIQDSCVHYRLVEDLAGWPGLPELLAAGTADIDWLARPTVVREPDHATFEVLPVIWDPPTAFAWGLERKLKCDLAGLPLVFGKRGHHADRVEAPRLRRGAVLAVGVVVGVVEPDLPNFQPGQFVNEWKRFGPWDLVLLVAGDEKHDVVEDDDIDPPIASASCRTNRCPASELRGSIFPSVGYRWAD